MVTESWPFSWVSWLAMPGALESAVNFLKELGLSVVEIKKDAPAQISQHLQLD